MLPQRQVIELIEPQAREDLDARVELSERASNARAKSSGVPVTLDGSATPQCAVVGWPGQTGHTSLAAWSHTVNTKCIAGAPERANSSQLLLRSPSLRAELPVQRKRTL